MIRVHSSSGRFIALLPDDLQGGFAVVATASGVASFRASWPCSHLGEQPIRFEFAGNGDLEGISTSRDGADVLALSEDAQEFGAACLERRRAKRTEVRP